MVRLVRGPKYAAGHWATDSESLTRGALREKAGLWPWIQKRYPPLPLRKVHTLAPPGDSRAQAVDLWWFPLGGFRFL